MQGGNQQIQWRAQIPPKYARKEENQQLNTGICAIPLNLANILIETLELYPRKGDPESSCKVADMGDGLTDESQSTLTPKITRNDMRAR